MKIKQNAIIKLTILILLSYNFCCCNLFKDKWYVSPKQNQKAVSIAEQWLITYADSIKLPTYVKFVFEGLEYNDGEWKGLHHYNNYSLFSYYGDTVGHRGYNINVRFYSNLKLKSISMDIDPKNSFLEVQYAPNGRCILFEKFIR